MKVMTVVGARPNFMKAAPIITSIRRRNRGVLASDDANQSEGANGFIRHVLVHTGQHYDQSLSDSFFADLGLPTPDFHLGVGSGSHAAQTAEIMRKFEEVLSHEKPDVLVVVGDVNSTLACALVAAKISFDAAGTRPLIAHVEAGLRSFDRTMPEEINRILTDQLSDLLFVTEESGLQNLIREGVDARKAHFVGNTMIDSLLAGQAKAEASTVLQELGLRSAQGGNGGSRSVLPYGLLTLHRPANVDTKEAFVNILEGLEELGRDYPVIFPIHPRTRKRIQDLGLRHYFAPLKDDRDPSSAGDSSAKGIHILEPQNYLNFLCLMQNAAIVVTDSGGVQEETTILGVPCVTVRENTERPVTITSGTNILAGTTSDRILLAIRQQIHNAKKQAAAPEKWDGNAGARIVDVLAHVRALSSNPSGSVAARVLPDASSPESTVPVHA